MAADRMDRRACADRYVAFLGHVDLHLVDGFDAQVLDWFIGPGKNEVAALSEEVWELLVRVVLKLCTTGVLAMVTVLQGLVYPTWRAAITASSPDQALTSTTPLRSIDALFQALTLSDESHANKAFPMTLIELHRLRCHRRDLFRPPYFVELLCETHSLVLVEQSNLFPEDIQHFAGQLWRATYSAAAFQRQLFEELDHIRDLLKQATTRSSMRDGEDMHVDEDGVPAAFGEALQTCINSTLLEGTCPYLVVFVD